MTRKRPAFDRVRRKRRESEHQLRRVLAGLARKLREPSGKADARNDEVRAFVRRHRRVRGFLTLAGTMILLAEVERRWGL